MPERARVGDSTQLAGRLGAVPQPGGLTDFRVWAPGAASVVVETASGVEALSAADDGMYIGTLLVPPGEDYLISVDGGPPLPDPCSRWQPQGMRGPSRVLNTNDFVWSSEPLPLRLDDLVLYELHVGTFTPEGTFAAAAARLGELADLGVTAVELMPVATFPGERGWGYDGVLVSAVHHAYGGPHGLARFVDAAHAAGLGVILDVVYNHVGPAADLVSSFGPYFADRNDHGLGRRLGLHGARRSRVGDPERRAVDSRLSNRRAAPRRDSRDRGRPLARPRAGGAAGPGEGVEPAGAGDLRDRYRRPATARGVGARRDLARRGPPSAPRPVDRRTRRLLRRLRQRRRAGAAADTGAPGAIRRVRPEPRSGRQPRAGRPSRRGRSSSGARGRALRPAHAAALHGRGIRRVRVRSRSSPITTSPGSPPRSREGADGSSPRSRSFAGDDVPDPQSERHVPPLEARPRGRPTRLPGADRSSPRVAAAAGRRDRRYGGCCSAVARRRSPSTWQRRPWSWRR